MISEDTKCTDFGIGNASEKTKAKILRGFLESDLERILGFRRKEEWDVNTAAIALHVKWDILAKPFEKELRKELGGHDGNRALDFTDFMNRNDKILDDWYMMVAAQQINEMVEFEVKCIAVEKRLGTKPVVKMWTGGVETGLED